MFGVVVLAARPWLPDLFTADRRVADLAAFVLVYVAVIEPVNGVVFALDGILIGAGDLRFLAWAMGGASVVFIAGAVVAPSIGWLWFCLSVFQVTRLAALLARWTTPSWLVEGAELRS